MMKSADSGKVRSMRIRYSPDADVLVIRLREERPVDSIDVVDEMIEIEILDASKVVDLENITFTGLRWVKI